MSALISAMRPSHAPLVVGAHKANFGHAETAAGLAGLHVLAAVALAHAAPNAQLRQLNTHLRAAAHPACIRPIQLGAVVGARHSGIDNAILCGVSSFGYQGTISHAVLRSSHTISHPISHPSSRPHTISHPISHPSSRQEVMSWPSTQLLYRRRCFPWATRTTTATSSGSGTAATCTYATCWVPLTTEARSRAAAAAAAPWVLTTAPWVLVAQLQPTVHAHAQFRQLVAGASSRASSLAVLLPDAGRSGASFGQGLHLMFALAQRLLAISGLISGDACARLMVLTSGVLESSRPAAGGQWGAARVLRVEQPRLNMQCMDVTHGRRLPHLASLIETPKEPEALWNHSEVPCAARLRVLTATPNQRLELTKLTKPQSRLELTKRQSRLELTKRQSPLPGIFVVTGGLGGLGLHAATLLSRQSHVLLASRTGRVARAGQRLGERLRALGRRAKVVACDVGDYAEVSMLQGIGLPFEGVLHAAGVAEAALLMDLTMLRVQWVLGPKAIGAWALHGSSACLPLRVRVLFSSCHSFACKCSLRRPHPPTGACALLLGRLGPRPRRPGRLRSGKCAARRLRILPSSSRADRAEHPVAAGERGGNGCSCLWTFDGPAPKYGGFCMRFARRVRVLPARAARTAYRHGFERRLGTPSNSA